jgi:hypothetical protein
MREVTYSEKGITKTEILSPETFAEKKRDVRIIILGWKRVDKK